MSKKEWAMFAHELGIRAGHATDPRVKNILRETQRAAKSVADALKQEVTPDGWRLEADWRPESVLFRQAQEAFPKLDIENEVAKFKDYWCYQRGARAIKSEQGWEAAFRNWIRKADEYSRRQSGSSAGNGRRRAGTSDAIWEAVQSVDHQG